jgi:hypothetical protein
MAASAYPTISQPAPATAGDAAPSARKLELAHQVVEATGIGASLSASMHDAVSRAFASLEPAGSADAQARWKVFADAQADASAKMSPKIVDSLVDSYARNFTEKELSDLLAFYRSPSGRSMVAKTPQVLRSVTTDLAGFLPQMRRDTGEQACAKLTCTPAERAAFGLAPATN